ncbi:MAG: DegT/DnrJ/EryC1/StrS family aminotransferase [Synergistetes bacterium]|nr:DegT/DnrJ/EryC1/StrS family aminotransferase [Synergistota bacterium]MCX8127954.1 DegT/DnrJ/EryC1/StrS family aminotransferase [Synergistota bacterium]MDW8192005.1 DegT/DnrJ/EryC1/StrS family aminotransferase [Synergistota bacterium]
MKIPLVDLKAQYERIKNEIISAVTSVLDSQQFILGEKVLEFESELSKYIGVKHAIGVASGSDALLLAYMALGLKSGDEIITTPFTFFATAGSAARLGIKVCFADIREDTFNVDIDSLLERVTSNTKAIVPVHIFGQAAEIDKIMDISHRTGIPIIEDLAQAIGAKFAGRKVGSFGLINCLSFFPSKNLGGYGDGGAVLTNSDSLAELIKMLRVHGSSSRYYHEIVGINSRLDEIQAAVLLVKMKYLDMWNEERRSRAKYYNYLFKESLLEEFVKTPVELENCYHVYHQYVIRAKDRDKLKDYLSGKGISTQVYYPVPLHLQPCFRGWGYKPGYCPVAERICGEVLALPMYPELSPSLQEYIVEAIASFYRKRV